MKTVKSALLGAKSLIDTNAEVLIIQLKEIIKEHRALIVTRMISELSVYLDYKFQFKAEKESLIIIKENLLLLKNSGVDLKHYDNVVQQLMNRAVVLTCIGIFGLRATSATLRCVPTTRSTRFGVCSVGRSKTCAAS